MRQGTQQKVNSIIILRQEDEVEEKEEKVEEKEEEKDREEERGREWG